MKALADVITDVNPIDRVSTNAWPDIRETVEATGRRTLLIAGLWTEGLPSPEPHRFRPLADEFTRSSLSATVPAE